MAVRSCVRLLPELIGLTVVAALVVIAILTVWAFRP
jgi:hypothetical protein